MTVVSELCDPLDGHATTRGGVAERRDSEAHRRRGRPHRDVTIDQVIAKQIGQDTPFPSLELATEDFTGYIGGCDTATAART